MKSTFPKLNEKQLEKLSDIASDAGLVALAAVVLPGLLDKFSATTVTLGGLATGFLWLISLWLRR